MLDRRFATFVQWVRRHIFLFCWPLISLCWKIDLANIEGALISNENIFFHFNLIHRRENIQTSALGKNTRCLQSGQARWLGPDCYMLGLCRYLQMNCTANSSISNSLFGLNKRRFILFLPSEKEKSSCFDMFFSKYIGLFKSDAATTPFSTCSSSLQSHPQHCEQAFAHHMSNAGMPGLDFAITDKKAWENIQGVVVHPKMLLFSPQNIPARAQDMCVCAWEWPWLTCEQESQDVPEWTKGVGNEAAIYVSNAHEIKWFLIPRALSFSLPF